GKPQRWLNPNDEVGALAQYSHSRFGILLALQHRHYQSVVRYFHSVRSVLEDKTTDIGSTVKSKENTRVLLMQMVNSLTSKLQPGSPMTCLYLLNNPVHYTNCVFKMCWWRNYIDEVCKSINEESLSPESPSKEPNLGGPDINLPSDKVVLMNNQGTYVGATNMNDYVFRPVALESYSVFDFARITTRVRCSPKQPADSKASLEETFSKPPVNVLSGDGDDRDWLDDDIGADAVPEVEDKL
ncbi:hypothetical protein K438DRAFT_2074995, partial [Mycena galopus ATCC 62051]